MSAFITKPPAQVFGPNYVSDANSLSQTREPHPESRYRVVDYCGDVHLYPPNP
jgi:lysine 2,3-aminomutase